MKKLSLEEIEAIRQININTPLGTLWEKVKKENQKKERKDLFSGIKLLTKNNNIDKITKR